MNIDLLWWVVEKKLAGMPMPYLDPERRFKGGGKLEEFDDDLKYLVDNDIKSVLCLLNIPSDRSVYEAVGIKFLCLPIKDYMPPTVNEMKTAYKFIKESNGAVAVHCEGGIGRTGTILAGYFILEGDSFEEAVQKVRNVEPAAIESPEQMAFLNSLAKAPNPGL